MKVNGRKISKMDMENNSGLMRQSIKVSIKMERNMEKECFFGRMIVLTKEIFSKTIYKDMVNMFGRMEGHSKANGKRIKCMEGVFLLGSMEESMKASTKMIKKKALEYLLFVMGEYMKANGKMESSTVKEYFVKRTLLEKVFGKMDNEFNGLTNQNKTNN